MARKLTSTGLETFSSCLLYTCETAYYNSDHHRDCCFHCSPRHGCSGCCCGRRCCCLCCDHNGCRERVCVCVCVWGGGVLSRSLVSFLLWSHCSFLFQGPPQLFVVVVASVRLQFSFDKSVPSVESVPAFTSDTAEPFTLTFGEVVVDLNGISPQNLPG